MNIKLLIGPDTTLADIREFVELTRKGDPDCPVYSMDEHMELNGIEATIFPEE